MIKAKQEFFWTCNLRDYSVHGNKATISYLTSGYYSLTMPSAKLYFLEIKSSTWKVMVIQVCDAENFEFKFSVRRHLKGTFKGWEQYWWSLYEVPQ